MKRLRKKSSKGITLIALVITIIVLIILAAVSIATLTGENGILTKANDAEKETGRTTAEEKVAIEVGASFDENGEFNRNTFKKRIEGIGGKVLSDNGDKIVVEVDGYEVTVDAQTGEILKVESKNGVRPKLQANFYTEDGGTLSENTNYADKTVILTVNITNYSELGKVDEIIVTNEAGTKQTQETQVIGTGHGSFKVAGKGKYTITVKATTEGVQKSASITTSVRVIPEGWVATTADDTEWYNYGGAEVNPPKLVGEMTPIKYTGNIPEENGNKWANAITADGSMWVWIPRYAYRINSGYHTSTAGEIEIKFLNGTGNTIENISETILTDPSEVTYENNKQNEFLVHPAFTGKPENGGWRTDVTGIWIAKFELSGDKNNAQVKAGVHGLGNMTINELYHLAKNSTFGESLTADQLGSHMAKNSEWGVVAYLAQSKYGTNGNAVETNGSTITGGSSTKLDIYETNRKQSTTFNAYGVYDMAGGMIEYVASYVYKGYSISNGGENAGDLLGQDDEERASSTPYKTVYGDEYSKTISFKGDAVWETSSGEGSSSTKYSWHSRWIELLESFCG